MAALSEPTMRAARIVSVIAASIISLACGTNYLYSAWAPQFADRLKLSSTEINLIGTSANLGMYASGIPVGIWVDSRGPRQAVIAGAFALGIGYFPIRYAYDKGANSMGVPLLCCFSFLTGAGSCSSFLAAIKTCALNYPHHRGTATAFPLAAFGLSAFFFSIISGFAFPGNTSDFLLFLTIGTSAMVIASFFFLRVIPHSTYSALRPNVGRFRSDSSHLHRTKPDESRIHSENLAGGYRHNAEAVIAQSRASYDNPVSSNADSETSSLLSGSEPGDLIYPPDDAKNYSEKIDFRGIALLNRLDFWLLFSLLGLLSGTGLMTINNIGYDTKAIWSHYDDSVSPEFIEQRQALHVSIISIASFFGRLLSGTGSDLIDKKLNMSRFWCLVIASSLFCAGQICAINVENPHFLWAVSGLSGLGYGALFGVYPTIIAETFGIHGLSQNWGSMTLSSVISGNIFNLFYGAIYDSHSTVNPTGERDCPEGLACYSTAYWVTLGASIGGLLLSLWCIWHELAVKKKRARNERRGDGGD